MTPDADPTSRAGIGPDTLAAKDAHNPGETVTVRYWAAARAAAGCAEEQVPAGTLEQIVATCGARHGGRLPSVLAYCSFLVDGSRVGSRGAVASVPVAPGSEVEVLPPFAGGA
jgi:molybdopterin converting factor small subunit